MGETTAVAHGAWVCVGHLRPHRCLPRGNPLMKALPPREATALLPKILLYLINSCLLPFL
ncbi:hypothetical protein BJP36_36450 [Moorena producens JHB]|uniref:Uncharacterized protein n=1 Tax=Moorena producens (strain JHB) TaxID=1454205 RepID=A0A9Q9STZ1_MOOP1|nr:hypothetical protein BJP36_36450 [Moorena producens JHB]